MLRKNIFTLFILISVVILFSIVGCYDMIEGMDNETQEILEVPVCKANDGICKDDKYMLKTSAIPPVCPACPYFSNIDEVKEEQQKLKDKLDKEENENQDDEESENQYNEESENKDIKNVNNVVQKQKQEIKNKVVYKGDYINNDPLNMLRNNIPTFSSKNSKDNHVTNENDYQKKHKDLMSAHFNNSMSSKLDATPISDAIYEIKRLKNEIKELKSVEQRPCPACERCPEPAFECKKVPNYSSTNVSQHLPVPILNDFSKF